MRRTLSNTIWIVGTSFSFETKRVIPVIDYKFTAFSMVFRHGNILLPHFHFFQYFFGSGGNMAHLALFLEAWALFSWKWALLFFFIGTTHSFFRVFVYYLQLLVKWFHQLAINDFIIFDCWHWSASLHFLSLFLLEVWQVDVMRSFFFDRLHQILYRLGSAWENRGEWFVRLSKARGLLLGYDSLFYKLGWFRF